MLGINNDKKMAHDWEMGDDCGEAPKRPVLSQTKISRNYVSVYLSFICAPFKTNYLGNGP